MRIFQKIVVVLLIVFIVAQFFQPEKNLGNPETLQPFLAYTDPPPKVDAILEKHCFDCHSAKTVYPWYGSITPVNFWMADHIEHGKKHFDLSQWEGYSTKQQDHKMEELIEMVEAKEMPLESYTYTHRDANLNDEEIRSIVDWAERVRLKLSLEQRPE